MTDGLAPAPGLGLDALRVLPLRLDFLAPFLSDLVELVSDPTDADFVLAMNSDAPDAGAALRQARRAAKPLAWWSIEDPNWFEAFLPQAAEADVVFSSDAACVDAYRSRLGHDRVHWLPLGCCPRRHRPMPLLDDACDFVISANWYVNEARLHGVDTVVRPLLEAGHSLALFSYASFAWPDEFRPYWRGEAGYLTTAEQYRAGRVVLGLNNQRSGLDGRGATYMTSMRTFEALACGKPLLAAASDAYGRLGFVCGEHLACVESAVDALAWADRLLGEDGARLASAGREAVLRGHTYAHRLAEIARRVLE